MIRSSLTRTGIGLCLLLVSMANASEIQGSAERGKEKTQMCVGCHSIEGWRTAFPRAYRVPRLGGQHEAYLKKALEEYKAGERSHPSMRAIAGSLSAQEIADLAVYYANQHP